MVRVGIVGFGKSFLAWNLAGAIEGAVIYADHRAPYRLWNAKVPVIEDWGKVQALNPKVVILDHEESETFPDVVFYSVPPDNFRIANALKAMQSSSYPIYGVLNGYEDTGVPWLFDPAWKPIAVIPWDMRQSTAIAVKTPLTQRDGEFKSYFAPLMEVIANVASS